MRITIILVAPARAENIGAAARAMKTMGFSELRIVDSQAHLEPATRRLYGSHRRRLCVGHFRGADLCSDRLRGRLPSERPPTDGWKPVQFAGIGFSGGAAGADQLLL